MEENFESIVQAFFLNSEEIIEAHCSSRPLPRLLLINGLQIDHAMADPIESLFYEIFVTETYTRGFYSPESGDNVIDCGANIGLFSLQLAKSAPGIRIFCFEPAIETRIRLINNICLNGLQSALTVFPFAITDQNGSGHLRLAASSGDNSLFPRPENSSGLEELVDCVTLSSALDMCDVEVIDMMKVDVEGAEIEILRGARNIDWRRIRRLTVEYHDLFRPGCRKSIVEMLLEYGFKMIEDSSRYEFTPLGIIRASR
jgi:FkbM family methyltransferase